jgi:hypothetical protein
MTIRDIARQYIADGWQVVPLVPGQKKAERSWNNEVYEPDDFADDYGIAGKCGEPSGHRVDIDLDHERAVAIAPLLLPQTGLIHGRPGKPDSHHWFISEGMKTTTFSDIKTNGSKTLLEVRSTGGYTALPPSVHPSGDVFAWAHQRAPLVLTPDALYEAARDVALATLAAIHWPSQNRHFCAAHFAGLLCFGGVHQAKVMEIVRAAATAARDEELDDRLKYTSSTIAKFRKGEKVTGGPTLAELVGADVVAKMRAWLKLADADALEQMNAKHFVVRLGKDDLIATEDTDETVFQHERSLRLRYKNRFVQTGVNKDGEPVLANLFEEWLISKDRREFRKVTFAPPPRGLAHPNDYNLWKGFAIEPQAGDCTLFLQHIREVICSGNDEYYTYLIKWLAWMIKNPGVQGEVAIVLRGDPGTGKGVFVRALCDLFGRHAIQLDRTKQITGFNKLISGKVLVFADEALFVGDPAQIATFKRMITEPTITVERKGIDADDEPNCMHLIFASNEDQVIDLMFGDRRYFALHVSNAKKGDFDYFAAIVAELKNGGLAAFLDLLLNTPVEHKEVLAYPETEEGVDQQRQSMKPHQEFLYETLQDASFGAHPWPKNHEDRWIKCHQLYDTYLEFVRKLHRVPLSKGSFGKLVGRVISTERSKAHRFPDGENCRGWDTRTLEEARREFDRWRGLKKMSEDWDDYTDGYQPELLS